MKFGKSDNEINSSMAFYAFRYCLGRSTYAVNDCVQWLIANWEVLEKNDQTLIIKEIREAIKTGKAGSEIDRLEWEKILDIVQGGN